MSVPASRVLFLGLDGGTPEVFGPAFERGWMPNLAAFWARSARGALRSSDPMVTPVAWTSFLTGCTPPTHGIHEFYHLDPNDRTIRPNHAGTIRVPTLWDLLGSAGRSIVSLNLPMTYPPPDVPGIIVAGSDAPGLEWAFAQCPDFAREIRRDVPDYSHKIIWKSRPRSLDELRGLAAKNRAIFAAQAGAAERADARVDWSALMVHFHNLDSLQHRLWPYLQVDQTGIEAKGWNAEVVACLRSLDDAVGRLLDLAARREAAVIAVSDHGFGPCRALVNVNGLLAEAGLQRPLSYGTRFHYRYRRLADRLERWRSKRTPGGAARRLPRSVDGEVGCDWKKTVAFAPFGQLSACVFFNPDLVADGAPADRLAGEVVEMLREIADPDTGDRLFRDAFVVADRYDLDPAGEGLPQVMGLSADGYQAQAKWSPFCRKRLKADPTLPATHRLQGVVAIDGPGIVPGGTLRADLHDLAPTTLAMLGLSVPEAMEGRVLHEAFDVPLPEVREDVDPWPIRRSRDLPAAFATETD